MLSRARCCGAKTSQGSGLGQHHILFSTHIAQYPKSTYMTCVLARGGPVPIRSLHSRPGEREKKHPQRVPVFCLTKGSRQSQNLDVAVLCMPNLLDSGEREGSRARESLLARGEGAGGHRRWPKAFGRRHGSEARGEIGRLVDSTRSHC